MIRILSYYSARAFTLIELVAVILVLAVLGGVAIPRYLDYRQNALESTEQAVLGAVRSAISNEQMKTATAGSAEWPNSLDAASAGSTASSANPFFITILQDGVTEDWVKGADENTYISPLGNTFVYLPEYGLLLTGDDYAQYLSGNCCLGG